MISLRWPEGWKRNARSLEIENVWNTSAQSCGEKLALFSRWLYSIWEYRRETTATFENLPCVTFLHTWARSNSVWSTCTYYRFNFCDGPTRLFCSYSHFHPRKLKHLDGKDVAWGYTDRKWQILEHSVGIQQRKRWVQKMIFWSLSEILPIIPNSLF